jgi:hypothetical protein
MLKQNQHHQDSLRTHICWKIMQFVINVRFWIAWKQAHFCGRILKSIVHAWFLISKLGWGQLVFAQTHKWKKFMLYCNLVKLFLKNKKDYALSSIWKTSIVMKLILRVIHHFTRSKNTLTLKLEANPWSSTFFKCLTWCIKVHAVL